jgi:hypothetical protein
MLEAETWTHSDVPLSTSTFPEAVMKIDRLMAGLLQWVVSFDCKVSNLDRET